MDIYDLRTDLQAGLACRRWKFISDHRIFGRVEPV